MLVEQAAAGESAFVTLTIEDQHLSWVVDPETEDISWTLQKPHVQAYIRSIRDQGYPFRYFACGEYGEETGRPHYHLIAFGLGIGAEEIFRRSWKKGFVTVYEANARTMSYVAKYCLKGSARPANTAIVAPFRLTSRNPPIGGGFAKNIADSLQTRTGSHVLIDDKVHMKGVIRMNGDKYPLDRTMKDRVIKELDIPTAMSDAVFRRDSVDPTDEETFQAAQQHRKALRKRHARTKL